jgi:hypothetical protein
MQAHNVDCAQLAFAEASGFDIHKTAFSNDSPPTFRPLDRENVNHRMKAFTEATHDVPTINCASCGERRINDTESRQFSLNELEVLRCSDARQQLYLTNPELQQHLTIFYHNDQLYDLHKALLLHNADESISASICANCSEAILKSKRPPFNVGCGHDYGLNVPSLSVAEKIVTSRTVMFQTILKLNGTDVNVSRGHTISFEHDGRHTSTQSLPRVNVDGLLAVAFVGSKENWTLLTRLGASRDRFLSSHPIMTIDPERVINFLKIKQILDPAYNDIIIDDTEEMKQRLKDLQNSIIDSALIGADKKSQQVEAESNPPLVTDPINDESPIIDNNNDDASIAMNHVFVHKPVTTPITRPEGILNIANQALTTNSRQPDGSEVLPIRVAEFPVNEFDSNETVFLGAFGSLFFLGEGIPQNSAALSQRLVEHLLNQYDNRFATNPHFLFSIFNQIQRHAAARNVSFRVKSNSRAMTTFAELMSDPNFPQRLEDATRNPDSLSAKKLLNIVLDVTRISGATVPWSRMDRESALWRIIALSLYAGTYSFFITVCDLFCFYSLLSSHALSACSS